MGGFLSRATAQASVVETARQAQGARLQHVIDQLPASSTVRQDIIAAAVAEERRIEREKMLDGISLEMQSARDDTLVQLANEAMKQKGGHIEFREHFLPMQESTIERQMATNVRLSHKNCLVLQDFGAHTRV
jgi:hypothetical protein